MSEPPAAILAPQEPGFPVPPRSPRSEPFWEGCRQGRLVLPRCSACGAPALRAFYVCSHCGERALAWETSAGVGTLYSWTVVWRAPHPGFATPYAPSVVRLDEGWWILSAVVGCAPEALRDALPLQVEFHPASDEVSLPYFRSVTS
jgi:uncharacterized OB-fold protein